MNGRYDDIINLPHHEPKRHRRMSRLERAAQFAPFAALRGYEDVIEQMRVQGEQAFLPDEEDIF